MSHLACKWGPRAADRTPPSRVRGLALEDCSVGWTGLGRHHVGRPPSPGSLCRSLCLRLWVPAGQRGRPALSPACCPGGACFERQGNPREPDPPRSLGHLASPGCQRLCIRISGPPWPRPASPPGGGEDPTQACTETTAAAAVRVLRDCKEETAGQWLAFPELEGLQARGQPRLLPGRRARTVWRNPGVEDRTRCQACDAVTSKGPSATGALTVRELMEGGVPSSPVF